MREPPARVRFIGHPAVATPILALCGLGVLASFQNPEVWILGVMAMIGLAWTGKAMEIMKRHRDWQRAWDSMAEPMPRKPRGPQTAKALIAVVPIAGCTASESGYLTIGSGAGPALTGLVALAALAAGFIVLRRLVQRRVARPRATKAVPAVAIRAARPLMPVPALTDAYRALPEHCWDLLGR